MGFLRSQRVAAAPLRDAIRGGGMGKRGLPRSRRGVQPPGPFFTSSFRRMMIRLRHLLWPRLPPHRGNAAFFGTSRNALLEERDDVDGQWPRKRSKTKVSKVTKATS